MRSSFIITPALALTAFFAVASTLSAQTDDISTGGSAAGERFPATTTVFGLYAPPVVKVRRTATIKDPAPASDFRNVEGREALDALDLTATERRLLRDNGLLLRAEGLASPGDAYATLPDNEIGSYITLDAGLADVRGLAVQAVAEAESGWMHDALAVELEGLAGTVGNMKEMDADVVRRALGYIETGRLLLEPDATVDSRVAQAVRRERDRVVAASGSGTSDVLGGRQMDYTLFRLSSSLDERRAQVQRARLWFTRVGLPLRDAGGVNLRAVLLIAHSLDMVRADAAASHRHDDLAALISTLAPTPDPALPISGFTRSYRLYVGRRLDNEPSLYTDDSTLNRYAVWLERDKGVLRQGEPRLFATPPLRPVVVPPGGTATPASNVEEVPSRSVDESMLVSLDGALALSVQGIMKGTPSSTDRLPRYMRSDAWERRLSLVETMKGLSGTAPEKASAGRSGSAVKAGDLIYVEPVPNGWAHIAALAGYLSSGLGAERFEPAVSRSTLQRLEEMESAATLLAQIAAAELAGRRPTAAEQTFLAAMCERLAAGAGTGESAMAIYAIVPVDSTGALALVRGGVAGTTSSSRLAGLVDPQRPADPVRHVAAGTTRALPSLPASSGGVQSQTYLTFDNGAWAPHDESEWWYTVRLATGVRGLVSVELVDLSGRPVGQRTTEWVDDGEMIGVLNPRELAPGTYTLRVRDGVGTPISSGLLAVVP